MSFTSMSTGQAFSHRVGAAMLLALGILLAFGPLDRSAAAQMVQSIAAVVNDEIISVHDLESRMDLVLAISNLPDTEETRRRLRPQLLRALIDEKLQMQEAERLNITVSAGEIQEAISTIERQNNLPVGGLGEYLRQNNLQLDTVLAQIKANIAWGKVVRREIRPQVDVGVEEVDEFLRRLRARGGSTEYEVSEIFIPIEAPGEEQIALQNAQRLLEQIRNGAPFAAVARQFSRSPTAAVGGNLGRVREGQLDTQLDRALAEMEPNTISAPIRVENGYYILLLRDKRTIAMPQPEDTTVSMRRILLALPPNASAEEVRTQSDLAQTVSGTVQGCADMERLGREVGAVEPVDIGTLKLGELSPELRNAVSSLPVGTASEPVRLDDGFVVLMVCDRNESMTGLPSREEVINLIGTQRISTMARRYMRDLRRVAFIDIRV